MVPIIGEVFVIASSNSIVPVAMGLLNVTECKIPGPVLSRVVVCVVIFEYAHVPVEPLGSLRNMPTGTVGFAI